MCSTYDSRGASAGRLPLGAGTDGRRGRLLGPEVSEVQYAGQPYRKFLSRRTTRDTYPQLARGDIGIEQCAAGALRDELPSFLKFQRPRRLARTALQSWVSPESRGLRQLSVPFGQLAALAGWAGPDVARVPARLLRRTVVPGGVDGDGRRLHLWLRPDRREVPPQAGK
jgi:hypothetical protein